MSEHFEVAIVGQQLPGLLLATELARAGRRVVVLQTQEEAALPPEPGLDPPALAHVLETLEAHAPHLRLAHQAMGLSHAATRPATRLRQPPACRAQIIFSHGRIELPGAGSPAAEGGAAAGERDPPAGAAEAGLALELAAEFPRARAWAASWAAAMAAEGARLAPLLARCRGGPPQGLWARWRARHLQAQLRPWGERACRSPLLAGCREPLARQLMVGLLPFVAGCEPSHATLLQTVRIWGRLLAGGPLGAEVGAAELLIPNFLDAARRAGAHVPDGQPLSRLHGSRRRLALCELENRRGQVGADLFVLNSAGPPPEALFTAPSGPRLRQALGRGRAAAGHLGRLTLQVAADCVPASLAPVAILLNGRGLRGPRAPADPPLCLQRGAPRGGRVPLRVDCPLPGPGDAAAPAAGGGEAQRQAQQAAQAAAMRHIMPRLGRLLPYLEVGSAGGGWSQGGRPIWGPGSGGVGAGGWGALQARGQGTPVANLLDGRSDVTAGLGLEGAYLLAQLTAERLRRAAGRAWREPRQGAA